MENKRILIKACGKRDSGIRESRENWTSGNVKIKQSNWKWGFRVEGEKKYKIRYWFLGKFRLPTAVYPLAPDFSALFIKSMDFICGNVFSIGEFARTFSASVKSRENSESARIIGDDSLYSFFFFFFCLIELNHLFFICTSNPIFVI